MPISTFKRGGIRFIKIGRFGCSVWASKPMPRERRKISMRQALAGAVAASMLLVTPCSVAHARGSHSGAGEHHHHRGGEG